MPAYHKLLTTLLSATILFGCSALDDDDDKSSTPKADKSLSGKVADGYLSGAKVCLDLNKNKVCDEGEPSTTSTDGGEFTLADVTQAQLDASPLLVEIITGTTIDEDNSGTPITKKYTLTAPAGYAFVSPLTTMVQSEIEDAGLTPEAAKGAVQAKLGTTLDLASDYVAGSKDGDDTAEFKRLHKVAQVTVVVLQNNIELIEKVMEGTDVSFEDLVGLIVSKVLDSLDDISTQVNSAGDSFDPTAVANSDGLKDANVDPATAKDAIAEREAARLIATANVAAVLANGDSLHFFDADKRNSTLEFSYGSVSKGENNTVSIQEHKFNPTTKTWVLDEDDSNDDDIICALADNKWNCAKEDPESIVIDGDKIIVKKGNLEATREEITGVSVDLSGKRILSFLEDEEFSLVTNPRANFAAGTTGYKLSFKRIKTLYALFNDNVTIVTDCWQGGSQPANIQVGQPFNPTDNWCNNVFIHTGDGNNTNDGTAATSLDQLITATAAINPTGISDIKGTRLNSRDLNVMAEFVNGGTVNYYVLKRNEGQPDTISNKVTGTWKQETIESKALLTFTIPPVLAVQGNVDQDERIQFFTVHDDFVRRGGIDPAGQRGNNKWVFNNSGRDQVFAAFKYELLTGLTSCTTGDVDFDSDNLAEKPGATLAEFNTAASDCNATALTEAELVDTTLATDFGFLNFKTSGNGVFLGEIGNKSNTVLDFTWSVNAGKVIINTMSDVTGTNVHLRLTLAKIEQSIRQISVKSFGQEAATAAALDSVKGNIEGEVWGLN